MQPANKCPMINEQSINHFFSVLHEKKKSYEENYKFFAPRLAPKFSIFNFVRRDENALSYIIANLIDPKGDHEQGTVFLELFIKLLDKKLGSEKEVIYSKIASNLACVKCVTESTTSQITNNQRRIDIVIDFCDFGIGIENKPWAFDQKNQLLDYSKELEKRYGENFLLIYLTGSDWEVSEYTIPQKELETLKSKSRFIQVTYTDLKDWLLECEAKCQADRVRNFLRDFAEYCDIQFGNGIIMSDESLIKEYLMENSANIELAFKIEKVLPKLKESVFDDTVRKLKNKFAEDAHELTIEASFNKQIISFKASNWDIQNITIMIEKGAWCYGIRKQKAESEYLTDAEIEIFAKVLDGKLQGHLKGWWNSFLIYFDKPYKYWDSDPSEFSKIVADNTELVKVIHKYITDVYDVIKLNKIQMS